MADLNSYYIFVACIKRNTTINKRLFISEISEPNLTYTPFRYNILL